MISIYGHMSLSWIVLGHDVLRSPVQVYTSVEAVDEPMTLQVEVTVGGQLFWCGEGHPIFTVDDFRELLVKNLHDIPKNQCFLHHLMVIFRKDGW